MKAKPSQSVSLATLALLAGPLFGQTAQTPSVTVKEAPAAAAPTAGPQDAILLRKLPAVLDARERRQNWKLAAADAEKLITNDDLRQQLDARLQGLVPMVAKELAEHTQEDALVSIAVYQKSATESEQAMVAVTFEGLGMNLPPQTLGAILSDVTPTPPEAEGVPAGLVYSPEASSYLVFFLGQHDLQAGDIPQQKMKQTIIAAANNLQVKQREEARADAARQAAAAGVAPGKQPLPNSGGVATASQPAGVNVNAEVLDPQTDNGASQPEVHPQIPVYPYGNPLNDGYYYPGAGTPLVILNGYQNTPGWTQTQVRREHALEERHRTVTQTPVPKASPAPTAASPKPAAPAAPPARPTAPSAGGHR